MEYIRPSEKEIANKSGIAFLMKDKEKWENEILPEASLSLKMNYRYLERVMGEG